MSSYLRIIGDFIPQKVIEELGIEIPPDCTWMKGDVERNGKVNEYSGLQFTVSQASFNDYQKQFKQATRFLSKNKTWLREIARRDYVEEAVVDFGLDQDTHPAYFRRLPLTLIQWAAVCGVEIELSFYAVSGKKPDVSGHVKPSKDNCSEGEEPVGN